MTMRKGCSSLLIGLIAATLGGDTAMGSDEGEASVGPLVRVTAGSPFGRLERCGSDPGFDPNQPNQEGRNFTGMEVEPWIVANPLDQRNLVAFWQQDRWSNGGARSNVAAVSVNGGRSWKRVVVPGLSECSGGEFGRTSDPWLDFSPDGTLHQMSLVVDISSDPTAPFGTGRNGMAVSRSNDGGRTWDDPLLLIDEDDPNALNDKNALTADPQDSQLVYAVWDRLDVTPPGLCGTLENAFIGPAFFTRTIDGGDSYSVPGPIYDPGCFNQTLGNQIVVAPDGTLINFFNNIIEVLAIEPEVIPNPGPPFNLSLLRSQDKGASWETEPTEVAFILSKGVNTPDTGEPVRDGSILFDVAVDSERGILYAVWQDARFLEPELSIDQIALSVSKDGGDTWSEPVRINKTPPTPAIPLRQQAFIPSVAVNRAGAVAITYYDFRNDRDGSREQADYFMILCERDCDAPSSFEQEVRLTNRSFDYTQAAETGAGLFLGDYMGLTANQHDFVAFFAQAFPRKRADEFSRTVTLGSR
ncbi:MAG: sialidase family protein [Pseudomonadota bacterium]